jgi:hypothetical protein
VLSSSLSPSLLPLSSPWQSSYSPMSVSSSLCLRFSARQVFRKRRISTSSSAKPVTTERVPQGTCLYSPAPRLLANAGLLVRSWGIGDESGDDCGQAQVASVLWVGSTAPPCTMAKDKVQDRTKHVQKISKIKSAALVGSDVLQLFWCEGFGVGCGRVRSAMTRRCHAKRVRDGR